MSERMFPDSMSSQEFNSHEVASPFAGFWRRAGAALVDGVLLGLVGFLLGIAFFDALASLGLWGRLIGFVIALVYFGILNSHIGHGQTLGKRLMRIRVVHIRAGKLSFPTSLLRYSVIAAPFFANGLSLPMSRTPIWVSLLLTLVVFGAGGAVIYLFLFNRPSRRSLHDLAAGSMVLRAESKGAEVPPIWRGHVVIVSVLLALSAVAVMISGKLSRQGLFADLGRVLRAVESSANIRSAGVFSGRRWGPGGARTYFTVTAQLSSSPTSVSDISETLAAQVFREYPEVDRVEELGIVSAYGYDIGIARSYVHRNTVLSPEEWLRRLGR